MKTEDQPDPTPNDSRPIWELVIEDMEARDQLGRERYGTPLQAHNGRDSLQDAYEEALDLAVYMRQAIEERAVALAFGRDSYAVAQLREALEISEGQSIAIGLALRKCRDQRDATRTEVDLWRGSFNDAQRRTRTAQGHAEEYMRERDEARAEVERLSADLSSMEDRRRMSAGHYSEMEAERDALRADVERLTGVLGRGNHVSALEFLRWDEGQSIEDLLGMGERDAINVAKSIARQQDLSFTTGELRQAFRQLTNPKGE